MTYDAESGLQPLYSIDPVTGARIDASCAAASSATQHGAHLESATSVDDGLRPDLVVAAVTQMLPHAEETWQAP